jgi:hypothetical protein
VHLACSRLAPDSRPAVWHGPDGPKEFQHRHYVIENLRDAIMSTRNSKSYDRHTLERMVIWLESEQREWGISNLVHRAAEIYGRILADAC